MSKQSSSFSASLIELATYIANRFEGDSRFGLLKLAKIIFFCDQEYFRRHGETFTDYHFYAWKNGPFNASLYKLDQVDHLTWDEGPSSQQRILVSTRAFDDTVIPIEVRDIADSFIESFMPMTFDEVSNYSHGVAWQISRGETDSNSGPEIPFSLYYLGEPEQLPRELEELLMSSIREAGNDPA
ncbi:MAG: Panacea domain-containing protein [bacterium]